MPSAYKPIFFSPICRINGNTALHRDIYPSVSAQIQKNFAKSKWRVSCWLVGARSRFTNKRQSLPSSNKPGHGCVGARPKAEILHGFPENRVQLLFIACLDQHSLLQSILVDSPQILHHGGLAKKVKGRTEELLPLYGRSEFHAPSADLFGCQIQLFLLSALRINWYFIYFKSFSKNLGGERDATRTMAF